MLRSGSMRRALVIVGKAPLPGQTKTRLVPPLSAEDAADLYRGFLLDAIELGLQLGWERVSVVHPHGSGPALAELVPAEVVLLEQVERGLGDALSHAFTSHLADGFDKVVLIGSDNPTLPRTTVEQAALALDVADLTIGPTADGGYYLIGMREPHPSVFESIDWSTSRVYRQTLAQAGRLALRVHTAQEWYDVDEPSDLDHLRLDLLSSRAGTAPHTRTALERLSSLAASH